MKVGIDDMSLYVPKLYLDIATLAEARGIEYAKLNKGLGLSKMAVIDFHEDAATMAANAIHDLISKNNLDPRDIGRIYMGTESALDGAKPTITYALEMLSTHYAEQYGEDCFLHCDVIDMTFACIGAVDALHNTMDWVRSNPYGVGIVVSSDYAKYELESTGEYTQGAGAIAMLVKSNPRLIAFNNTWGIATRGVHDFFKPRREASKTDVIREVLDLAGIAQTNVSQYLDQLYQNLEVNGILDANDKKLMIHKDTPVFDGQYSNICYQDRITEAFDHFLSQSDYNASETPIDVWDRLIFHLPYAFHAKRMFPAIFVQELEKAGTLSEILDQNNIIRPNLTDYVDSTEYEAANRGFLKSVSRTPVYRAFVQQKMSKGQEVSGEVGNMYAGAIFLSLIGTLEADYLEGNDLSGSKIGFFGYGSGSKSKVVEGVVQPGWKHVASKLGVQKRLSARQEISYKEYEDLHTMNRSTSLNPPNLEFALKEIESEGNRLGARTYFFAS